MSVSNKKIIGGIAGVTIMIISGTSAAEIYHSAGTSMVPKTIEEYTYQMQSEQGKTVETIIREAENEMNGKEPVFNYTGNKRNKDPGYGDRQEKVDPNPSELFANVEDDKVSYNWNAQVQIEGRQGPQDNPGFNGINLQFTVATYIGYKFSDGSDQQKLHDKICKSVENRNGFGVYDGAILMAAPICYAPGDTHNWAGWRGRMLNGEGKQIDVIYIDVKGNVGNDTVIANANETPGTFPLKGHLVGGYIDIFEIIKDSGQQINKERFRQTFGLNMSRDLPIKSFTKDKRLIE